MAWSAAAREAAANARRRNAKMVTVYHGTTLDAVRAIRKSGALRPQKAKTAQVNAFGYGAIRSKSVYVSTFKRTAELYAQNREMVLRQRGQRKGTTPVVMTFKVPASKLRPDKAADAGTGSKIVFGGISAKRLKRLEKADNYD